jgi:alkyl sulfatase BDS1-like metallo-beta-lactamase superfamily hydrolase
MTVRLIAEEAFDTHVTLGFVATDTEEDCGLEIRRGVCQFHPSLPESRDATLSFPREFLSIWAGGVKSFDDGIESGDVSLAGDRSVVTKFFEKFEPPEGTGPFGMSVR